MDNTSSDLNVGTAVLMVMIRQVIDRQSYLDVVEVCNGACWINKHWVRYELHRNPLSIFARY